MKTLIMTLIVLGQSLAFAAGNGGGFKLPTCDSLQSVTVSAGEFQEATGVDFKSHFTQSTLELYASGVEVSKGTFISVNDLKRVGLLNVAVLTNCPNQDAEAIFMRVTELGSTLTKNKTQLGELLPATKNQNSELVEYISDEAVVSVDFGHLTKTELALGTSKKPVITLEMSNLTIMR